MITKRIIVEGRLQKIGFSYATRQIAMGFDVIGWVRHQADGSVELVIEGEPLEVTEFIDEITEESTLAHHIKKIIKEDISPLENITGFTIIKNS
jgi:acylphosphatase